MRKLSLQSRIVSLLREPEGAGTAKNLLPIIRDNIKETQNRLQQLRLIILTIFVAFLLIYSGIVSEFEVSGIKLTNDNLILILTSIPLVISYFYYELVTFFVSRRLLIDTHEQLIKILEPDIFKNKLIEFYLPTSTYTINNILSVNTSKSRYWNIFMKDFGGVIGSMTILFPFLFCTFSYIIAINKVFFLNANENYLARGILTLSLPLVVTFLSNSIFIIYHSILILKKNEKNI